MDNYINKVVEKMQEDCEPFANIEWVKSILTEMSQLSYEAGQQSQQAKVEEMQSQLSLQRHRVKGFEEELTSSRNYGDELQKRVDAALRILEVGRETGVWKVGEVEQALKGEGNA